MTTQSWPLQEVNSSASTPDLTQRIHSCAFCQVQEVDPSIQKRGPSGNPIPAIVIRYRGNKVIHGGSNGCLFFKHLLEQLTTVLDAQEHEIDYRSPTFQAFNWIFELRFHHNRNNSRLESADGSWTCAEGELPDSQRNPQIESTRYILSAHANDVAAKSISIRSFSHDLQSQSSAAWSRRRLLECEQLHQDCQSESAVFYPKRLLKIEGRLENTLHVRVVLSDSQEFQATTKKYATLSYCWGTSQTIYLRHESYHLLVRGLAISDLPQTLSDAIQVAWKLGTKWIWIDSLCIMQDDVEGKAEEVAQMYMVYRHSFVTISAARASNCHEGFLHPCSLPGQSVTGHALPYASPCGRLGSIILSEGRATSPIDERAWTFQEHLLARRVLRFTDFGLYWTCKSVAMHEKNSQSALPTLHVHQLREIEELCKGLRDVNLECGHWMRVVDLYTKRHLTDPADRLPATSGIAEFWRTRWGSPWQDSYLAGLWATHLPEALLWTSAQPFLQNVGDPYRAPSWSWASLNGQIDFFLHMIRDVDPALKDIRHRMRLVHNNAPFGAVAGGVLWLTGRVQLSTTNLMGWAREDYISYGCNGDLDLELAGIYMDYWGETLESKLAGMQVYGLQICLYDESSGNGPTGLILTSNDETTFQRIGVFDFEEPQDHEAKEAVDFGAMREDWARRKLMQETAFNDVEPRRIAIV